MRFVLLLLYCLLQVLLLGCESRITTEKDLYLYTEDSRNGVKIFKEEGDLRTSIRYFIDADSSLLHFCLAYQYKGKDMLASLNESSYAVIMNRLSFKLDHYLTYSCGGKEENITGYQFVPTYGMMTSTETVFVIPRKKVKDATEIQFRLKDIGLGLPKQEFVFQFQNLLKLDRITDGIKLKE